MPLRAVAALAPTAGLRRAWTWLTFAILFCFLARAAAAIGRLQATVGPSDVLDAFVHLAGPGFVLGVAWLSLKTGRELIRLGAFERLAFEDPLTGLGNRRAFEARLAVELAEADRSGRPVFLAIVDVDHFKQVNDRFGHDAGDGVLRAVARSLQDPRFRGLAFRIGGDEFAIIVGGIGREQAPEAAEEFRRAVQLANVTPWRSGRESFTVSIGGAASEPDDTPDTLFMRADRTLYAAKRAGRNVSLAA